MTMGEAYAEVRRKPSKQGVKCQNYKTGISMA